MLRTFIVFLCVLFSGSTLAITQPEAREIAARHVHDAAHGLVQDWDGATVLAAAKPVFRSDITGVAYWEFKVERDAAPAGFVIVSTGPHDFPISHWRSSGATPSEQLATSKLFRTDALTYDAEPALELSASNEWRRSRYLDHLRQEAGPAWKQLKKRLSDPTEQDATWSQAFVPMPVPAYNQFAPGVGPNSSACASGCGATAWAIVFGWADIQASLAEPWAHAGGIYEAVAPEAMDAGVETMSWEIRGQIGTWCTNGSGATSPWNMGGAGNYLAGRSTASVSYFYNAMGLSERRLANHAIDWIVNQHKPAIIGTGWLSHYPVAIGYAVQVEDPSNQWFFVNQGWGGTGNDWVAVSTWFAGTINP